MKCKLHARGDVSNESGEGYTTGAVSSTLVEMFLFQFRLFRHPSSKLHARGDVSQELGAEV